MPFAIVLVIAVLIILIFTGRKDYDAFATCLADKGFVMAGAEWCSHCATQKGLFKGAFEDIIMPAGGYKDCDLDQQWCADAGVTGYPSWVMPDGNILVGVQSLSKLSQASGCSLG